MMKAGDWASLSLRPTPWERAKRALAMCCAAGAIILGVVYLFGTVIPFLSGHGHTLLPSEWMSGHFREYPWFLSFYMFWSDKHPAFCFFLNLVANLLLLWVCFVGIRWMFLRLSEGLDRSGRAEEMISRRKVR